MPRTTKKKNPHTEENEDFKPDPANKEMLNALQLLRETNESFFLTGKAGTGKSTLVRYIRKHLHKKCVMLAPTGIAALNVGGQTIHRFFKVPIRPLPPDDRDLSDRKISQTFKYNKEQKDLLRELELIIIDEVSMVRADIIDVIDRILRAYRGVHNEPFGGVQILFVGDLYQLEPVTDADERDILRNYYPDMYFFSARVFNKQKPLTIELTKVYRQADARFVGVLGHFRTGAVTVEDLQMINSRVGQTLSEKDMVLRLSTTRALVDHHNTDRLNDLETEEVIFTGKIVGDFPERDLPTELHLKLKEQAQVMFLSNHPDQFWANGTLGIIEHIDEEGTVSVRLEDGQIHTVEEYIWENIRYTYSHEEHKVKTEVIGQFVQLPLKLAWAITIHKSQGLTFNHVSIDFGTRIFAAGQAYVALSRCRSLEGIHMQRAVQPHEIISRTAVDRFYSQANSDTRMSAALDRAKAEAGYIQAAIAWRKRQFADASNYLAEAMNICNLFDKPVYRRMLTNRIYSMAQTQQETIEKQAKRLTEQDKLMKELALEYVTMGNDCITGLNEPEAAIRNYNKALRLNPTQIEAMVGKGRAFMKMNDAHGAMSALNDAVALAPKNAEALIAIGEAALHFGYPENAEGYLLKALTLKKHRRKVLDLLIKTYEKLGDDELYDKFRKMRKKEDNPE
ncbi:DEAD/DEAH box helicase [Porphyromonas macacae]|nr:PIF1 family ATP-dependent DNA helicase [Porphyromonas macacae]